MEFLIDTFLHGLSDEIKGEPAARELPMDLNPLIALTIRINGISALNLPVIPAPILP
jgi:hypothetical protein